MFEGNRFLPLTGIPIWKMARRSTVLAVWLPEPFTVATEMLKSLTTRFTRLLWISSVELAHGDTSRLAHVHVGRVRGDAALARGGEQQLVLAVVGHDVAAREDAVDRRAHVAVHLDLVALGGDPPALDRVEVHGGS